MRNPSQAKIERIIEILFAAPMNTLAIAEKIPMSKRYTLEYLKYMRTCRMIHVAAWDRDIAERKKRYPIEVWKLGAGDDAAKPAPDSIAVRSKRYRNNINRPDPKKMDEETYDAWCSRKEALKARRRTQKTIQSKQPDIAAAWCFPTTSQQNEQHNHC